jgi:hypothetical protein
LPALSAHALDLIAVSTLSGTYQDLSNDTAGLLENGIPGNRLGGLGSAIAYAGGDTFLALPDRGPNAQPFDSNPDDTVSYINRFHTFHLRLQQNVDFNASDVRLTAVRPDPDSASDDSALEPDTVFIADEYGPYVYQFDRITGKRIRAFTLPPAFAVTKLSPVGNNEISGNTSGRVANKGMEGLAITPDGRTLVGAMQSPLIQDGGTNAAVTRIVTIDIRSGAVTHPFLVDERDGNGFEGSATPPLEKRLYRIDINGATDVSRISGEANLSGKQLAKSLFLDIGPVLNNRGIPDSNIPAKIEGIAFGPDVTINGQAEHTLFVTNDNDDTLAAGCIEP